MLQQETFRLLDKMVSQESVVVLKRILECPECHAVFETKDELDSHSLSHDEVFKFFDVAMELVMYKPKVVLEHTTIYECMKCTRGFTQREEYELHKLIHLKESFNKEEQYMKRFKCKYCDLSFVESELLDVHLPTHRPFPYVCFCGVGYRFVSTLEEHLDLVHRLEFKEPTGLTNEVFDSLVNEWQENHFDFTMESMKGPFSATNLDYNTSEKVLCQFCNSAQKSNGKSLLHLELEDRLKMFIDTNKCEECGMQFIQTPSLRVYKCYLCLKAYLGCRSILSHESEVHEHQEEENLNSVLGEVSNDMENLF